MDVSRRTFLASGTTTLAVSAAAAAGIGGCVPAALVRRAAPASGESGQRVLLRGGVVAPHPTAAPSP